MPSNRIDGTLRDILHHIDLAAEFAGTADRQAFAADLRAVYAVTRCLEIISEASRRLPEKLKERPQRSHGDRWRRQAMSIATTMKMLQHILCGRLFSRLCQLSRQSSKRR